jgi:putative methyltransferase (TIGR04325 family)
LAVVTQIFPNFDAALAACGSGYNDAEIADVMAYKAAIAVDPRHFAPEQATNSILSVGIAAADITERPLAVLDFGGGCGFHYFHVVAATPIPLRWAIVETPIMAERAARLAQGRFDTFTEIATAAKALGRIDLVHTSGAIQYVPEPLATLKALAQLRPRYFALARFPVWGKAQIVGLQTSPLSDHGIGPMPSSIANRQIEYPITFTNFDHVMQTLADYDIKLAIPSPSAAYGVRGQHVQGITIIFRLRTG